MSERASFELLRGHSEEEGIRLFLKIFTEKSYMMVELDESELTDLRSKLNEPPTEFDGAQFGDD